MSTARLAARTKNGAADSRLSLGERFDPRRFFDGERVEAGPILLTHRRIFMLPNRRGFGLALLLIVQFLIAINYGNNLAFMLTFLLVSIALSSILYTFRNLAGLRVRAGKAAPVFDGDPASFEVHVDNPSRLPRFGLNAVVRGTEGSVSFEAPAGSTRTVQLQQQTKGRGWLPMATMRLSTRYPLGIFRAWSPLNLEQRVLIYPRPAPIGIDPPTAPSSEGTVDQNRRSDDDDFSGFQEYRPGDPLKRIHWKGVAKGQGVHVKHYAGHSGAAVDLDWQHTPGDEIEKRLSVLCRWVLDAERAGTAYSLRLPGKAIDRGLGEAHRTHCLEALALCVL